MRDKAPIFDIDKALAGDRVQKPHGTFWKAVLFVLLFYFLFLKLLFSYAGGWMASNEWFSIKAGLPSSGKETFIYFTLALLAVFSYVSYDEERWEEFKRPVVNFLLWKSGWRTAGLVAVPLLVTSVVFYNQTAGSSPPSFAPIRHPTPPDEFSKLVNPFRSPTGQMLDAFDKEIKEGKIGAEESAEQLVREYVKLVESGRSDEARRRRAFERRCIEEGRNLFMINCRPCHGTKAMGDGPLSTGLLREPADFTGVETIATLVEGAVFWRIRKGGVSLPDEGGSWESAMPKWETDLTDQQIWKIIMAEYDIAGNRPREPEKTK